MELTYFSIDSIMNKFFFYIALVLTISIHIHPQGEWIKLDSPTSVKLEKLFCIDSLNCWAAGDSGLIIHTSNGGVNWEIQNSEVFNPIQDIFFLNHNLGWAVSTRFDSLSGSYIIKTTNGGKVWEKEFFNIENKFFHAIYFLDSLNGWVAGNYAFYGTTDGGFTWDTPQFDSSIYSSLPVLKIDFFSKQYGFACGGRIDLMGVIWKTTDAGLSWSTTAMCCEPLRELYLVDSLNIIGVGGDFEYGTAIARTSDGGDNWIYELPGFLGIATGLSLRNKSEAWACLGSEQKFIVSENLGKTWDAVRTYENTVIYDLVFTDSLHGFAVGDSGVILKYKSNYVSDIGNDNLNFPSTVYLFQNYPNPFNPKTKIKFTIPASSLNTSPYQGERNREKFISLKVYDILGTEVATLVDEFKPVGNYEVEFGGSLNNQFLSSGIYFYRLRVVSPQGQAFVQTKKMLLLR